MHTDKKNIGRGAVKILHKKAFDVTGQKKHDDDDCGYQHIRNVHTRKTIDASRQARRCEHFAYRLSMKRLGKWKDVHTKLNKDALHKIVKEAAGVWHL